MNKSDWKKAYDACEAYARACHAEKDGETYDRVVDAGAEAVDAVRCIGWDVSSDENFPGWPEWTLKATELEIAQGMLARVVDLGVSNPPMPTGPREALLAACDLIGNAGDNAHDMGDAEALETYGWTADGIGEVVAILQRIAEKL